MSEERSEWETLIARMGALEAASVRDEEEAHVDGDKLLLDAIRLAASLPPTPDEAEALTDAWVRIKKWFR